MHCTCPFHSYCKKKLLFECLGRGDEKKREKKNNKRDEKIRGSRGREKTEKLKMPKNSLCKRRQSDWGRGET